MFGPLLALAWLPKDAALWADLPGIWREASRGDRAGLVLVAVCLVVYMVAAILLAVVDGTWEPLR